MSITLNSGVRFGAQFDQSKPAKTEFDVFGMPENNYENKTNSKIELVDMLSGAPVDSLLNVKDPETKQPLITAQDVFNWTKYDHMVNKRDCPAYTRVKVNPLIALAAGLAHGADFGRCGWRALDLGPLKQEFPRVFNAVATRVGKKIEELKSLNAATAGLYPVIDFIAKNTDKYYMDGDKAVLMD